jgi:large subunit ribosomal protein L6e
MVYRGTTPAGRLAKRTAKLMTAVKVDVDKKVAVDKLKPWKSYKKPFNGQHLLKRKQVTKVRPTKLRASLVPGAIVIIVSGKYRGRRAVLLKDLGAGTLLVHGVFNGVPLKRVSAAHVIGTSTKVALPAGLAAGVTSELFKKKRVHQGTTKFFNVTKARENKPKFVHADKLSAENKAVSSSLKKVVEATPFLKGYLKTSFRLYRGTLPHLMKF